MSKGSISKKEIPTPEKGIRKMRKKKKKKKKNYNLSTSEAFKRHIVSIIWNK
jgi:hypothetical protein